MRRVALGVLLGYAIVAGLMAAASTSLIDLSRSLVLGDRWVANVAAHDRFVRSAARAIAYAGDIKLTAVVVVLAALLAWGETPTAAPVGLAALVLAGSDGLAAAAAAFGRRAAPLATTHHLVISPSRDALRAVTALLILAALIDSHYRSYWLWGLAGALAALVTAATCFSGQSWLSDSVVGAAIAVVWTAVAVAGMARMTSLRKPKRRRGLADTLMEGLESLRASFSDQED